MVVQGRGFVYVIISISFLCTITCWINNGKTAQIPCFSKKCNPWTAEPSHVFPEQQMFQFFFLEQHKQKLVVPKQHKNI